MGIGLDGIAKAEIKNKINKLKREIQELEQIKEKYKKMNNKIESSLYKENNHKNRICSTEIKKCRNI